MCLASRSTVEKSDGDSIETVILVANAMKESIGDEGAVRGPDSGEPGEISIHVPFDQMCGTIPTLIATVDGTEEMTNPV